MSFFTEISSFLIQNADAETTTAANQQGGGLSLLIMTGIFIFLMYFILWRPQSQRTKEHRKLLNSLNKGDEVVTTGGMLGRIIKITDSYVTLAISDHVEITLQKNSISNVLPKGTLKSI